MLKDMKIDDFLEELGSDSAAPGGGSVAALAGALAGGLISMVGRLSGKCEEQEKIQKVITKSDAVAKDLQDLIDKDTQAFNKVMDAFKMAKSSDEEKAERSKAIQAAMKEAAITPLQVMEKAIEAMELSKDIAVIGNKNAITDAGVSGIMGYASVKGAAYNVQINLLSIKDEDFKREKADRLSKLLIKSKNISKEIENTVQKEIGV